MRPFASSLPAGPSAGRRHGLGVAAEVLFPDGITEMNSPPFGAGLALKPWGIDPELQWAGARAHNRWIAEFCKEDPVRRIGLAIVLMLYDVDDALAEVQWAHRNGLKGILIPALMGDRDPYNHPKYYPIWQYCEEHNLVVHTHSGPTPDYNYELPGAIGIFLTEFAWWAGRPMWHMIFGGVFEKFPRLKFAMTEVSEFWIPHLLELMDVRASVKHTSGKLGDFRSNLTMAPSEYFRRQVYVGCEPFEDPLFELAAELLGDDNLVLATDTPHWDSSVPEAAVRPVLESTKLSESTKHKVLGLNAAKLLGLPTGARV